MSKKPNLKRAFEVLDLTNVEDDEKIADRGVPREPTSLACSVVSPSPCLSDNHDHVEAPPGNVINDNPLLEVTMGSAAAARIFIPGNPVAMKQRKFSGKNGRYYSPSAIAMKSVRDKIQDQLKSKLPEAIKGPITVWAHFNYKRPNAEGKVPWKWGRKIQMRTVHPKYPCTNPYPDCDNLCKFIGDCMNKCVYEDDIQIVNLYASKRYTDYEPSTSISIYKLK